MTEHTSVWKPLVDDWVSREQLLYPDSPVKSDSVKVRDAVEIDDQAYVLVSYDVDHPWPAEEDLDNDRAENIAVLLAKRVKQPWVESDYARSLSRFVTDDGKATVHEHLLGPRRAFSGYIDGHYRSISLEFDDGSSSEASVVDGWFLALGSDSHRLSKVLATPSNGDDPYAGALVREDIEDGSMLESTSFARTAGRSLYFSPLDLRGVHPLVQWQRSGSMVVVGVCLEQYDTGGILRLRIDGIRRDDDAFVSWPVVTLETSSGKIPTVICGEYGNKDTASIDVGFTPWFDASVEKVDVKLDGLRGAEGPIAPLTLTLDITKSR